jgi:hypothetical protein
LLEEEVGIYPHERLIDMLGEVFTLPRLDVMKEFRS